MTERQGAMSVAPASSNVHGQLDAQIAQLTQCKPLPEQEVSPLLLPSSALFVCSAWLHVWSVERGDFFVRRGLRDCECGVFKNK